MTSLILSAILSIFLTKNSLILGAQIVPENVLAERQISLNDRNSNTWVNNVFKENILLTIAYGRKLELQGQSVNWTEVNKPFHWSFKLEPGKVFTFHNLVLPKYSADAQPWSNIHFYTSEGFLSDGWLIGDGVCHLASLMGWVAKDAGLAVEAPTNHNFAAIPEVPKQEGVAIYYDPNSLTVSGLQNLYIKNNKDRPVDFVFDFDGNNLTFRIEES